jgi:hypothetical protein
VKSKAKFATSVSKPTSNSVILSGFISGFPISVRTAPTPYCEFTALHKVGIASVLPGRIPVSP